MSMTVGTISWVGQKIELTFVSSCMLKAVDKWVLGGAEAPPNFWHLYLKDIP